MLHPAPDILIAIPVFLILIDLFVIVCRWRVFGKMGLHRWMSLIPVLREYKVYRKCWKQWPFFVLLIAMLVFIAFVPAAGLLDLDYALPPSAETVTWFNAVTCAILILILKNKRLAFAFGYDIGFTLGLIFLHPVFIAILAFSKKAVFMQERAELHGKSHKQYLHEHRDLRNRILSTVCVVALAFLVVGITAYSVLTEHKPGFIVDKELSKIHEQTSGIVSGRGQVIYPAIDEAVKENLDVRPLYFPDKSQVAETAVYMYIVGSDLEDGSGSASINLTQIKEATAAGSRLQFIIEAGGSYRWFTDGIKTGKTARYIIKDGEITLLEKLPNKTSMSDKETLTNFLTWANENYPSDRKMLFFWDHGAALSGFGYDVLHERKNPKLLSISDIVEALDQSAAKYDLIAFDACLMQTMEVGLSMEPYADYLLASEEMEPASGLYYTAAFSRLATEPDLSTLKFGAMMCSSYDQSLEAIRGRPEAGATMSMIELRYMPIVSQTFIGYLQKLDNQFTKDRSSFINMSTARAKAYEFGMEDQIDLIDFIRHSNIPQAQKDAMIGKINKAIAVRNSASANHINGLAVYMPYDNIPAYTKMHEAMEDLGMRAEEKVYNDFASIIGSQKVTKGSSAHGASEYYNENWYVKDFKDYNSSYYMQDVALIKEGDTYIIDLPAEQWDTITSCDKGLKVMVGDYYADLGRHSLSASDGKDRYTIGFNDTWVAINDVLAALHPGTPKDVGGGKTVQTGTVDALLGFTKRITIYIEWVEGEDGQGKGKVLGYLPADQNSDIIETTGMPRGYEQFKASDFISLLYDWYSIDDNYIMTAPGHPPILVGTQGLQLTQQDISTENYKVYGILQDAMHREILTKTIEHEGEK